jgi:adenylate cyclase
MSKKSSKTTQDMDALFLQETDGAVMVFDLRDFSRLAAEQAPLDLGAALSAYYVHCEKCILGHDGRVVKFAGDAVIGVWLANQARDHAQKAIAAMTTSAREREAWLERNAKLKLPVLDYSVALAEGPLLAGQIGTPRFRSFDILGEAVNISTKLTTVATSRDLHHISAVQPPAGTYAKMIEVEGIELGGRQIRLWRLDA